MIDFAIVACARWETQYISEWIQYYDVLGFDRIYLYCNDDDPSELKAQVENTKTSRSGFVVFKHFEGQGEQAAMYFDAMKLARNESRWVMFLDIDEFLVLRNSNSIKSFMDQRQDSTDSVHFNWINFGNSGFASRPSGGVLQKYLFRADGLAANTKHISRTEFLSDERLRGGGFPFWHGLADPIWTGMRRTNALGANVASLFNQHPRDMQNYLNTPGVQAALLDTAVINHYCFKSEEDFLLRANRGLAGQFAGQAVWGEHWKNGTHKSALAHLGVARDVYLSDFSKLAWPETNECSANDKPNPGNDRIRVHHRLWVDDLILEETGRLAHASHGSKASYTLQDDVLHVKWDDYPADLFMRSGEVFVHAGPAPDAAANLKQKLQASIGSCRISIAAVALAVPNTDHLVEIRPGGSDVEVFAAIFFAEECSRPALPFPVDFVVDLGANTGLSSVHFALKYPSARIIAVEPEENNFKWLRRNIRAFPNVIPVHGAIWPTDMRLKLRIMDASGERLADWAFQTEVAERHDGNAIGISIPTLMERYGLRTIDLLKIDIEGAEVELFEGDVEAWLPLVRSLVIETHERFRPGADALVTRAMARDFDERTRSGENRIFARRW